MGIDIDGTMIVGRWGETLQAQTEIDDIYDFLVEDNEMDAISTYYDCPVEHMVFGYKIENTSVDDLDNKWLNTVKAKAEKFKELTGLDAELMGLADVC